jgi:hypothetical protein
MLAILAEVGRAESRFRMPRADGSLMEVDSYTEVAGDGFTDPATGFGRYGGDGGLAIAASFWWPSRPTFDAAPLYLAASPRCPAAQDLEGPVRSRMLRIVAVTGVLALVVPASAMADTGGGTTPVDDYLVSAGFTFSDHGVSYAGNASVEDERISGQRNGSFGFEGSGTSQLCDAGTPVTR